MDHEEGLGTDADDLVAAFRMRHTGAENRGQLLSWEQLTDSAKQVWRVRFWNDRKWAIDQRRRFALKIAVAAARDWDVVPASADDFGKALGRFALAAADKILE